MKKSLRDQCFTIAGYAMVAVTIPLVAGLIIIVDDVTRDTEGPITANARKLLHLDGQVLAESDSPASTKISTETPITPETIPSEYLAKSSISAENDGNKLPEFTNEDLPNLTESPILAMENPVLPIESFALPIVAEEFPNPANFETPQLLPPPVPNFKNIVDEEKERKGKELMEKVIAGMAKALEANAECLSKLDSMHEARDSLLSRFFEREISRKDFEREISALSKEEWKIEMQLFLDLLEIRDGEGAAMLEYLDKDLFKTLLFRENSESNKFLK